MRTHAEGPGDLRYRAIFEHAAVSLWEEDISRLRARLHELRQAEIELRSWLPDHPEFTQEAVGLIEVIDVNQATLRLLETPRKDMLLGPIRVELTDISRAAMNETILAIDEGRTDVEAESTVVTLGGRTLHLIAKTYVPPADSPYDRLLVSFVDITARKEAEQRERRSAAILQSLIESIPDAVFVKDRDLRMVLCNAVHSRSVGKEPPETCGKTDIENGWDERLVRGDPSRGIAGWEKDDRAALAGATVQATAVPSNVAGTVRYFDAVKFPLRDPSGAVFGIGGIGRDVTERWRLERRNQQLATLVESSDDAIVGIGMDRRITVWNGGAERIYGFTAEEMTGSPTTLLIPEELEEEARLIRERLARGERIEHFETVRRRKDGKRITVSLTLSAIRDEAGEVVGMASVARDVTAQKAIEARLAQVKRLESVATLAGGVAHQFNNINTVVKGYLDILKREPGLSDRLQRFVSAADDAINRAVDVTERLLMMTETGANRAARVRLDVLARNVVAGFGKLLSVEGVRLELRTEEVPAVAGEESRMRFVVSSLLVNALDAVLDRPTRIVTLDTGLAPDGVFLEVRDTGCGIPASDVSKVFLPFFSTKGEWAPKGSPQARLRGLGLNLSISNSTVADYGGRIEVRSTEGEGSAFRVVMPLPVREAESPPSGPPPGE